MDRRDGDYFVGVFDFVFVLAGVLVFIGSAVHCRICSDFDDGGYEYHGAEPRAGSFAGAGNGGVRDDVYGSAADWIAGGGRRGEAYWGAANTGGVWGDCADGERRVCGEDDDEDAGGGGAGGRMTT